MNRLNFMCERAAYYPDPRIVKLRIDKRRSTWKGKPLPFLGLDDAFKVYGIKMAIRCSQPDRSSSVSDLDQITGTTPDGPFPPADKIHSLKTWGLEPCPSNIFWNGNKKIFPTKKEIAGYMDEYANDLLARMKVAVENPE